MRTLIAPELRSGRNSTTSAANSFTVSTTGPTVVVTSPVSATTEAIHAGRTGLVADVEQPAAWVEALQRLEVDDALAESLRQAARRWVEENYDAHQNTARLVDCFEQAMKD